MLKIVSIGIFCIFCLASFNIFPKKTYPDKLSEWNFFKGKLSELAPSKDVVPYSLNTPLFTDYAEKSRFVRLPSGKSVNYQKEGVLDFPEGTAIVKTFYYSADFRNPGKDKNIIETRVLIKEQEEWKALSYVWNEEQTDAIREIAGDEKQVQFIDQQGITQKVRYVIPNQNQCKGCHNSNDQLMPIGPSASQLNGNLNYPTGKENQLKYWSKHGMIENLPSYASIPKTAIWNDPLSGDLNARARAYLAINCAHCHRREGPAQTSGLYLTESETDITALGINKPPVAAGKGSGGRLVDIHAGDANASILWYRMHTNNPGERMPELGRSLAHQEGLALITEWINKMK
jgi:uncharacterized repeat protein (TIGR03806 family)